MQIWPLQIAQKSARLEAAKRKFAPVPEETEGASRNGLSQVGVLEDDAMGARALSATCCKK